MIRRDIQERLLRTIYPDYVVTRHDAFVERAQKEVEQVVYYNWSNKMGIQLRLPQVGDWAWWFVWLREHALERDELQLARNCWHSFGFTGKTDKDSVEAWLQMLGCAHFVLAVTGLEVE